MKFMLWFVLGWLTGAAAVVKAVKPGACAVDLERVSTDLRLCNGTLAVARSQLRACERR